MVNLSLILAGVAIFAFFASGGLKKASAFLGSDLVGEQQKQESGQVTTDSLQKNPSIPIPQGSQTTVATIQASEIIRTDVTSKRKFNQGSSKPMIKTSFFNPKEGGSEPQAGIIKTSANISGSFKFGQLTKSQVGEIRAQPFTEQELQDIDALTIRFAGKSKSAQRVSDSPEEIVLKKREQAFISRQVLGGSNFIKSNLNVSGAPTGVQVEFGGVDFSRIDRGLTPRGFSLGGSKEAGLFGNPNFLLGGVSPEVFKQQRMDREEIFTKQAENKALNEQREATGRQIISTIAKSGMNQKQFLLNKGVALRGGDLNPRAIARLRERGLLWVL